MTVSNGEMNLRLIALAESPDARFWRVDYHELSPPERVFRAIWELEAEVNNGGLEQYFFNSSGSLVPDVVDALRTVGAFRMAKIVEDAIGLMPTDVDWRDTDVRRGMLIALPQATEDALDTLNEEFHRYPDNLTGLLYAYVCNHRAEVGLPTDL